MLDLASDKALQAPKILEKFSYCHELNSSPSTLVNVNTSLPMARTSMNLEEKYMWKRGARIKMPVSLCV